VQGAGVLDISNSSGSGVTVESLSGSGFVSLGSKDLAIGTNNASTTFSGILNDGSLGGSLTKIGTGTLTLTGANAYAGGANINAGTLSIGNGTALGTGVATLNGGVLSMGAPTSILTLGGFTENTNGTLQMGLGGAGVTIHDWISVVGNASLSGALTFTDLGGLTIPVGNSAVIMTTTGTLSGTFQQITENINGIRLVPVYFSNAVEALSINPSFQSSGATANQKAMGADLDAIALNPKVNSLITSIGVLSNSALQTTYGELTPEDFTALYQAGFEGALSRQALVDQRLSQFMANVDNTVWLPGFSDSGSPMFASTLPASKEAAMTPSKPSPMGGFISGDGGIFNVASDGNAAGYKVTTFGLTGAGVDYRFSRQFMGGLMVGYGHTDISLGTGGALTADGGQVGVYGLYYSDGLYAGGLLEGGINSYGTQRQGYNGIAKGTMQGSEFDGALEVGYQWKQAEVKVGPMAMVDFSQVKMDGLTESGSQADLTLPGQSESSLLSRLGIRANGQWELGTDSYLNPSLELAWEHEFDFQGGVMTAGFGAGDNFTVAGPQIGQDGIMAGIGADITFSKSFTLSLQYQGEFARTNLTSSGVGGGVRVGF
jgi:outer membrane autotransporter protein